MIGKNNAPLLWMLAIPLLSNIYVWLNHSGYQVHSLVTPLDERTPFLPVFAIPYLLWYPFLAVTLVAIFRQSYLAYVRTLLAICMGLLACYAVYFLFQTTVPRPDITSDGLLHRLAALVYRSDQPYNCFPSIHVMTSCLMIKGSIVLRPRFRMAVLTTAVCIIASTLFIKQHVIADVAAGILFAEVMFRLAAWLLAGPRSRMLPDSLRKLRYTDHE
ncbi:phosphatase PAP2 family protein [Cohnella sp. CFH 77786]|uniref:phosphatase PAP2 family protein n=1 Tax=Cohnella sp. CFH 77786 TaxID=2662265 RepID=UPI001C60B874|nr:phosphatase PAP2 family protein [Cohnella sp. CFH 77786]